MNPIGMGEQSEEQRHRFEAEAIGIVENASHVDVTLRLLGSLAFHIHCPRYGSLQRELGRAYTDLDFAAYGAQASRISPLLATMGYKEDLEVNTYFAGKRMIFHHPKNGIHIDIFLDELDFCHTIHWAHRLEKDSPTIPLAELLLEKMQIVKINEKDVIDTMMLLLEHPLGDQDSETINIALISHLCAQDWGLWRTVTMNLGKVAQLAKNYPQITPPDLSRIQLQVEKALNTINATPKSLAWKVRSRVGDRVKWYQDVDDVI